MNRQEYEQLETERAFLQGQLAEMPAAALLTRSSVGARLQWVESQLVQGGPKAPEPARVRLLFRGRPVAGSHGIFVEFGTRATAAFADALATVGAALLGPLAPKGPIPHRDRCQFLVTGAAVGSFGFELEEYLSDARQPDEGSSIARQAVRITHNLLAQSTLGSDDELAEAASASQPRAIDAVRTFVDVLAANDAVCDLQTEEKSFRFHDSSDVHRSLARLGRDHLREEEASQAGVFVGLLPHSRTFEFKPVNGEEVMRGKIGPAIGEAGIINQHLYEPTEIRVLTTQAGQAKPRFVLLALPDWPAAK